MQSNVLAGIELGTSHIRVLVGECLPRQNTVHIIGFAETPARGMLKGGIVDLQAVSRGVSEAIDEAESSAGSRIHRACLAIGAPHLRGEIRRGYATVSGADGTVSDQDIRRAQTEARRKQLPQDRVCLHHIRTCIYLDGEEIENPMGMSGGRVEVEYWTIHGDDQRVRDMLRLFNGYNIEVKDVVTSSIAAGTAVASDEEKRAGLLLIDIGAGCCKYVVYRHGRVYRTAVLPLGGDHLVNDLSLGLRISRGNAEELLHRTGLPDTEQDGAGSIWLKGDYSIGDREIPLKSVEKILHLRLEEMFTLIRNDVERHVRLGDLGSGVAIVGGVARMEGLARVATETCGTHVACRGNPDWVSEDLRRPQYATVLGLLHYTLQQEGYAREKRKTRQGLLDKVTGFFH